MFEGKCQHILSREGHNTSMISRLFEMHSILCGESSQHIPIILEYGILNLSSEVSEGDISQSKINMGYFCPFPKGFCCPSVTQLLSLSCSDCRLPVCTIWFGRDVTVGKVLNRDSRLSHFLHVLPFAGLIINLLIAVHAVNIPSWFELLYDFDLPYPSLATSESCSSLLQPRDVIPEDWILLISSRALARESRSPESWCWASHRLRITDDGLSWHAK